MRHTTHNPEDTRRDLEGLRVMFAAYMASTQTIPDEHHAAFICLQARLISELPDKSDRIITYFP